MGCDRKNDSVLQFSLLTEMRDHLSIFHHLFQSADPEQVFEEFREEVQGNQESVQDWILRLKELCNAVKRYRANVPFNRFVEQILVGSKSESFLTKFRHVH